MRRKSFEARVRELVSIHGPADALEPRRALKMAVEVLVHGLIEEHNSVAAFGNRPIDAAGSSRLRRAIAPHVASILARIRDERISNPVHVGAIIVDTCFGSRAKPYLDTNEIPWLVGLAYSLALEVEQSDPGLARRLVLGEEGQEFVP
jgi:hypothetical protein